MPSVLSAESFARLLASFDADPDRAGEKYEQLRHVLIRFFEWRGAPFPEEHADETFDRVARKLDGDTAIVNIGGYCYEVARLICLEAFKRRTRSVSIDAHAAPVLAAQEPHSHDDRELRHACLDECLAGMPPESRRLILEYYRDDRRARIDGRRALAEQLGLQRETLANRAQRVRNRLERCVGRCTGRQRTI
jgi:RNA polymerase sigma factor (sigma-70 family)